MTTYAIQVGSTILWRGKAHKITRIINTSYVLGACVDTAELEKIPISEIRLPEKKKSSGKQKVDVSELNEKDWELAEKRFAIIESLIKKGNTRTKKCVYEVADKSGVSAPTLYRWLRNYEATGKTSSLINKKRDDKGGSRLQDEQDKLLDICIQRDFLKPERPTIKQAYDGYVAECNQSGIKHCSISSFRRRVNKIAPQAIALKRYSRKYVHQKHAEATGKFPGGRFPLDVVQIDHTKPNVILVDDRDREPIGRPWVTFAIDIYSRMIVGFFLSFEAPSATSVALCMTHSLCRKDTWLAQHNLDTSWPCWGLMRVLHADNGGDFRSRALDRACSEYGIEVNWRPLGRADYGGHVERLMRTVKTDLSNLKGTTFSNPIDRGEYDSEGRAIFTFDEFQEWLVIYITKIYHQRNHSSLGMPPIAKWEEGLFYGDDTPMLGLPEMIEDERRLYLDFLPFERRTVQRYGISIGSINYFHPSIARWIGVKAPTEDGKFIVKYELHQVNHVYFLDPDTKEYLEIPRIQRDAPNMTRFELKKIRLYLKNKGQENIDEQALIDAQRELKEIESRAGKETKAVRRMRQRKVQAPKAIAHVSLQSAIEPDVSANNEWDDIDGFDDVDLDI